MEDSAVFRVGFLTGVLTALFLILFPATRGLADYESYQADVARLEALAKTDVAAAQNDAQQYKSQLLKEKSVNQGLADKAAQQADAFRELAKSARESAAHNKDLAKEYAGEAKAPDASDKYKALMSQQSAQSADAAVRDEARAADYDRKAAKIRADSEARHDAIAELDGLIARLAKILGKTPRAAPEKPAQAPELTPEQQLAKTLNPPAGTHPGFNVESAVGLWRSVSGPEFAIVIAQARPGDTVYPDKLELHTNDRVWKGEFSPFPTGDVRRQQDARMVFHYTPQPREMNPELPDWVATAIDGHLNWRLEIDEIGPLFGPHLRVKWFRGEVHWTEGAERRAWVEGDGKPLIFDMAQDMLFDITRSASITLWLAPVGAPDFGLSEPPPLDGVIKGQPFRIYVRMPPSLAIKRGPRIKVKVKNVTGSGEDEVELVGPVVTRATAGSRGIVYTNDGELTIADPFTQPDRNPQFMSLGQLSQIWARSFEKATRLNLRAKNRDIVEVTYDGARQQVSVFEDPVKRMLAQLETEYELRRALAAETVSDNKAKRADREAATQQLRLLANYQTLMARADLLDMHKLFLGRLYLHGVAAAGLICTGEQCHDSPLKKPLFTLTKATIDAMARDLSAEAASTPLIEPVNKLVETLLANVTGTDLTPAAKRVRNSVHWVGDGEAMIVGLVLKSASDKVLARFQTNVAELAYAMPKTVTEDFKILFEGRNFKNDRISSADRALTLSHMVWTILAFYVQGKVSESIGRLRGLVHEPIGDGYDTRFILRLSARAKQSPERAARPVNMPERVALESVTPDMPTNLKPAQVRQTALKFYPGDDFGDDILETCGGSADRIKLDVDPNLTLAQAIREAANSHSIEGKVRRAYHGDPDIRVEAEGVYHKQQGNTCVGNSGGYMLREATGGKENMAADQVLADIAQNMNETSRLAWQRAYTRLAKARKDLARARVEGMPTKKLEKLVGVRTLRVKSLKRRREGVEGGLKTTAERIEHLKEDQVRFHHVKSFLRRKGLEVANLDIMQNERVKLGHLKALRDQGWQVMVAIERPGEVGHAIAVTDFEIAGGQISRVYWFDPAHNAILSTRAAKFDRMLIRYPAVRLNAKGDQILLANPAIVVARFSTGE